MYDDFFDFGPNTKERAVAILIVIAFLVAVFCAGYMSGIRNAGTGGISDYGDGTGNVGEQLGTAAVNQRDLTEGIGSAAAGASRIEGGIQQVSEATERAEVGVTEAGRIIDESQQILGRIRNRGQKGTLAN